MKFKFINELDPYYEEARMLRWEILEKPHGIPPGFRSLVEEKKCLHFIALEKNKLMGCAVFCFLSPKEGKIFDCAFADVKAGFGRKMIHEIESRFLEKGVDHVQVVVQVDKEELFTLLGYIKEGKVFEEYGVSYQKMEKALTLCA